MSLKKAGLVGLLAAAAFIAIPASAATVEDLQAQINALMAQLASLQGGASTGGCYGFTADLTVGSQGADVVALQTFLEAKGFFTYVGAKGYFGGITQASVAAWQAANGVTPAAGYFGPISRAKYNSMCGGTSSGGGGSTSGNSFFTGDDEGSLENFDQMSKYSNEQVGEDEEDVPVAGLEVDADGADQMIERVTVVIDNPSLSTEDDLGDFIQDVSLTLDGEELGRMDVEDASYDRSADEYTFRFTGLEGIIADGDTAKLVVNVTGNSNLDSAIDGEGWDVTIPDNGIRASSPNGVTETYDGVITSESFTVESFATANDVELHAKKNSDSPDEQTVIGDSNNEFDVDLLAFTLEATGSDIDVFGLSFDIATSTGVDVTAAINDLTLTCGGDDWSENVMATGTVTFGDVEFTVDEDDSIDCTLSANVNQIDGSDVSEGDILSAKLLVDQSDAEDQSGENLDTTALTGTANGFDQTLISEGLSIDNVDSDAVLTFSANDTGETSQGKFTVEFDVTANDTSVYLDKSMNYSGTTGVDGEGVYFTIDSVGAGSSTVDSAILECVSNCGNSADNGAGDGEFFIDEGDTETYRLTVNMTGDSGASDSFKVWIDSLNWSTEDLATADQFYTSNLGEDSDADTGFLLLSDM
jgi:peptidoglycan hydrolase-like protein with peptidoglycan-binding domain